VGRGFDAIACSQQLTCDPSGHTKLQVSMFDYDPPREKQAVDYTGLKIGAALLPVFFFLFSLSNADVALTVFIILGMIILAIKLRWHLRKHLWFWSVMGFILALHLPLVRLVRWPQGNTPTLFYAMPFGIADFLIISGALGLAERLFLKGSSSTSAGG
jgi:hypothetical protein